MLSCSYGILYREARGFLFVNATYGHPLDIIVDITLDDDNNSQIVEFKDYDEQAIRTLLTDDDYTIVRLIFTSNNDGSILTSRYQVYTETGKPDVYVMSEKDYIQSLWFAKFVLWCDAIRNDFPKTIESAMKITRLVVKEDKEEMICAICHEEYEAGHIIGTLLRCKHSYHEKCIKKWFNEKLHCPICRRVIFSMS